MDGRKLIKSIKKKNPRIYAILMGGAILDDDYKSMKKYHIDAILKKLFMRQILLDTIENGRK